MSYKIAEHIYEMLIEENEEVLIPKSYFVELIESESRNSAGSFVAVPLIPDPGYAYICFLSQYDGPPIEPGDLVMIDGDYYEIVYSDDQELITFGYYKNDVGERAKVYFLTSGYCKLEDVL